MHKASSEKKRQKRRPLYWRVYVYMYMILPFCIGLVMHNNLLDWIILFLQTIALCLPIIAPEPSDALWCFVSFLNVYDLKEKINMYRHIYIYSFISTIRMNVSWYCILSTFWMKTRRFLHVEDIMLRLIGLLFHSFTTNSWNGSDHQRLLFHTAVWKITVTYKWLSIISRNDNMMMSEVGNINSLWCERFRSGLNNMPTV